MVCVASDGQGTIEIWDSFGGADEPQMKTLQISQSMRVADLVSHVCYQHKHKIGSVGLILRWDGNKVDLTHVRQDRTIADIGVDFTSGSTYSLYIGEWPSFSSDSDEQKMPDNGESSFLLKVVDVTTGGYLQTNIAILPGTRVNELFRLIGHVHEPGTFGLFIRGGRIKRELKEKDTRKLTELGVDFNLTDKVMLLVTDPADSPITSPSKEEEEICERTVDGEFGAITCFPKSAVTFDQRFPDLLDKSKSGKNDTTNMVHRRASNELMQEARPDDVESDRRSESYVGLVNQAMTCYLNSLLQALYMTPEFRNALYNWEYVNDPEKDEALSIPYQLQKLFLNLQTSTKNAIETTSLTKSFGWDSTQAWQQHDIQELCRVMFDALEQKFKNTEQADLINRLYEGKMIDYVKCLECSTEKSREDTFLDIPLPVRPFGSNVAYNSVEEALNAFVQPETLDGTNQYHCETCSKKCDAHKGLKFTKFPYLLTLHLKRFDFDYNTFHRIKLNDEVTFPDVLNLNSFIQSTEINDAPCNEEDAGVGVKCEDGSTTDSPQPDEKCPPCENHVTASEQTSNHDRDDDSGIDLSNGPSSSSCSTHNNENDKNRGDRSRSKGPYEYELFSIMIHSGSASGGHYYAYIKDFRTGDWLCFNDQNVSPITYDDIQKTYGGGPTRAYYSGVYSSSTNAYMLMYRQVDPERNSLPMQVKDFPKHLQELLLKMQDNQDRTYRDYSSNSYRLKVYYKAANDKPMEHMILCGSHDQTWNGLTSRACRLWPGVPRDQARLVTYQERTGMIECSFEGREEETVGSILDEPRDLLLEIREKNEKFKPCLPGGVMSKVFVVDVAKKEVVKGPINVRGLMTQTVGDYKIQLSEMIDVEPKNINLIMQNQNYSSAKLITNDDSQLMDENFTNCGKIFVPTFFDTSTAKTIEDGIYKLTKIFGDLTLLNIELPDTSEENLRQLSIPRLDEKVKEKIVEVPLRNGPTKLCTTITEPSAESEKSESNDATSTKTVVTDDNTGVRTESSPLTVQTESEDWHTSEQCNSEDSSLSYSDRTLVGEGDASEDDDYSLATHDHGFHHQTEEENWDIDDPSDYYFRATSQPDKTLRVFIDRQMTVVTLKKFLEPYVGVPMQYFKICPTTDGESGDPSRLVALSFVKDGMRLELKLGRVLRSNEIKVKFHLLNLEVEDDEPYRSLCEWIVTKEATVAQTKKEILVNLKKNFDIDIPFDRCRLRKKNKKTASTVYLDDQKIKDLDMHWPYDIIVQKLPGKEPVKDDNDVVIFARQMPAAIKRLGPIQELVVSGKYLNEVREKLSELSGIPEENLELARGESFLPADLVLDWLVLQNGLDWNRQSRTLENSPEIDLEDGAVIYYRDWREEKVDETISEGGRVRERYQSSKPKARSSRTLGSPTSSRYSPRRERALKIYIDDK